MKKANSQQFPLIRSLSQSGEGYLLFLHQTQKKINFQKKRIMGKQQPILSKPTRFFFIRSQLINLFIRIHRYQLLKNSGNTKMKPIFEVFHLKQ